MRQVTNSTWECSSCGAIICIERGKTPSSIFVTLSGSTSERVVLVDWQEVHRCGHNGVGARQ